MRFLRLDLRAFGPFADAPMLELGGGGRGLHLIHGPNEAGKSTALRAIRCLLFGFPLQSGDDHLHKYDKLRVGATLRGETGDELSFVRRKRNVNPLWTFDDARALDPDALGPFLGALDEAKFVDLFSMDHAELVAGGLAILKGGGRLGEMLFAAGSGLARVDEVRRKLDEEMDALFRPRASNPSINAALAELKDAREAAEQQMLGTQAWVDLDHRIARARGRLAEIEGERPAVEAERLRLERLRKALPLIARREEAAGELDRLRGVPVLSDDFAEVRRAESTALALASRGARDARAGLEEVGRELAGLGPADPVVAEAEAIGPLQGDLGVYLKECRERPAREAKRAHVEADARGRLAGLFPSGGVEEAGGLRALAARRGLVLELAERLARLEAATAQAEAEVAKLAGPRPGADDPAMDPEAPRHARDLAGVVARVAALGDPEGLLGDARAELGEAELRAALGLRALPLWSGSLDELEALAVPPTATIDRSEAQLRAAEEALGRAEAALAQAEGDRRTLERQIEVLRLAGPVPTEEELAARRLDRDRGWGRVRRAWLGSEPAEDPPGLADDHEAGVRAADDLADRLRREADRVAEQAQRAAGHRSILARVAALAEDRDRKTRARAEVLQAWAGLWRTLLGLDPFPPREMRDWVVLARAALVQQADEIRGRRSRSDRSAGRVAEHRTELGRGLARLGEPGAEPGESLAALLDRARAAVAGVDSGLRLVAARSDRARAEAALGAWRSRWAEAVRPLGLDDGASPARANAVLAGVDELIKATDESAALGEAIREGERLGRRFEGAVGALLGRLGEAAPSGDSEADARAILARLDRARLADARREGLLRRQAEERSRLAGAGAEVDRAEATLAALAREARCGGAPGDLAEAQRASDEVKALRDKLRGLDDRLADLAEAGPVDRLREEARGLDPSDLDARIAALGERLDPLKAEGRRLGEEIGSCLEQLRRMDGGPAAADARQDVEERMARLAEDVEKYARLRLASAVLREAVERYRKEHQGPVLDRAGGLFARLTAGSFAGLRADVDEKGQPVLRGVRADGSSLLGVEGMSEGTADQLYLALRLASLETYLDDHEPIPLVVDDILVNFDNARALAALEALAALSTRTQILFFTHHEHLVDLARSALGGDVLFVHRLDRGTPRAETETEGEPEPAPAGPVKPRRKKKAPPLAGEG